MAQRGLFVGLTTVDLQYRVETFPERDAKTNASGFAMSTGGPAANAAVTFAHLGGTARLLTRIGAHALAPFMSADLERYGVEPVDLAPDDPALPTVSSVISVPATGERTIVTHRPERALSIAPDQLDAALEGIDVVLVDGHVMTVQVAVAAAARARGIPVVLDGGSWKPGTDELLRHVDAAICSEAFRLPGTLAVEDTLAELASCAARRVAITRGPGSVRWREGRQDGEVAVPRVDAVDTSGAGDVFHGAFCAYQDVMPFPEALARAAAVASRSCRDFGARAWMDEPA